jgi:hypothetical protein
VAVVMVGLRVVARAEDPQEGQVFQAEQLAAALGVVLWEALVALVMVGLRAVARAEDLREVQVHQADQLAAALGVVL